MSIFTKRRKEIRKQQEEQRKQLEENSKRQDKSMQLIIDTAKYIDEHHPEFESLNEDERIKLFGETFKKIQNDT